MKSVKKCGRLTVKQNGGSSFNDAISISFWQLLLLLLYGTDKRRLKVKPLPQRGNKILIKMKETDLDLLWWNDTAKKEDELMRIIEQVLKTTFSLKLCDFV